MMSTVELVDAACDGCGSRRASLLFMGSDRLLDLPGEFRLVICADCGLIRQSPIPAWEDLKKYYPEEYQPYQPIIAEEKSRLRRLDRGYGMQKRVRAVARYQPTGLLLDIGCGTGIFLGEAQRSGRWQLEGIEPSPAAADYVQKTLGIPVHAARFEDTSLPAAAYDVITMWNVLEHLEHPIQALRKAHDLLKPGGWLVVTIPNVESLAARVFGRYWLGWDLPRHLYLFPGRVMLAYLKEVGFSLVDRRCIAGSHAMLGMSLDILARARGMQPETAAILRAVYESYPLRLLLAPAFFVSDRLRLSSALTWFVRSQLD